MLTYPHVGKGVIVERNGHKIEQCHEIHRGYRGEGGNVSCRSAQRKGYSTFYTYSDDGRNLVLSKQDDECRVEYRYQHGTNLVTVQLTYEGGELRERQFQSIAYMSVASLTMMG